MTTLIHGTTRYRAEQIILHGPNPRYVEPGGLPTNDGFSTYVETGPYPYLLPEEYAEGKSRQCPTEGGPVILVIDNVPDDVLEAANRQGWFPLHEGVVQFDTGEGLEELQAVWHALPKMIRDV